MKTEPGVVSENGKNARNLQLDVLRGLAILLVIGAHLPHVPNGGIVGAVAGIWHSFGGFGVPLFFTLSGYLVGGLLLSELRQYGKISVKRFLIRRTLKIWPAYFFFLSYLVLNPTMKSLWQGNMSDVFQNLIPAYFPNVLFINNYYGNNPAGHTWSLAVEEHFYLFLPLFISALVACKGLKLLLPFCLLSPLLFTLIRLTAAYAGDPYIHSMPRAMAATHLWADSLLLGVGLRALAELAPQTFSNLAQARWLFGPLAAACLYALNAPLPEIFGVPAWRILPFSTIAAASILLCVIQARLNVPNRFASSALLSITRVVAWIGFYSYSIYLWHVTALGITNQHVIHHVLTGPSEGAAWILETIALCTAAVMIGALMARLVEWPVMRLRDRYFPSRSLSRPSLAPAPEPLQLTMISRHS